MSEENESEDFEVSIRVLGNEIYRSLKWSS